MRGHAECDGEHEDAVQDERIEDAHCGHVMDGIGAEKKKRPAATDHGASKETEAFLFLEIDAAAQKTNGYRETDERFPCGAEVEHSLNAEICDADDEQSNTDFVEPVCAKRFFDAGDFLHALLKSWLGRGNAKW